MTHAHPLYLSGGQPSFMLTAKQIKAAHRMAEDHLSDEAIAKEAGVTRQGLYKWKAKPEFQEAMAAHVETIRQESEKFGVASIENQLKRLNEHRKALLQIIAERAAEHGNDELLGYVHDAIKITDWSAAGATTGLIVRQLKGVGKGEDFQLVEVYELSIDILRELRDIELQALKITGKLVEKRDLTTNGKGFDLLGLSELSDDELDRRIREAESRASQKAV